jgi:HEAT repeat protein
LDKALSQLQNSSTHQNRAFEAGCIPSSSSTRCGIAFVRRDLAASHPLQSASKSSIFLSTGVLQLARFLFSCLLFFSTASVCADEIAVKRVYDHLRIHDYSSAVEEAKRTLELFPESKALQNAYVRALCAQGNETEAWEEWQKTLSVYAEEASNRQMLEVIAWGVLNKGEVSTQPAIRLNALLGAAFTRDAKAIPLLVEQMRSSHALLRSIAIKLSASYGDAPLLDEIARLLSQEKVWYVRLEAIQAAGQLRMEQIKPELKEIIGNPKTLAEEKVAAILALVSMYESVDREELKQLTHSDRAGLRQLGCEVICHLNLIEHLDLIAPLLQDPSPDVRLSALNTLGLLRIRTLEDQPVLSLIEKNLNDTSPPVAITASYVALLLESKKGEEKLEGWLNSEIAEWRRLASAALSASGKYGVRLALKGLKESRDPYVKVNLALGLIGQRVEVKRACRVIDKVFASEHKTLWMWEEAYNPLFRSLAPSRVSHIDQIPHYPMVVDQMARLELLSVLSIVRYPNAQAAVKGFLQKAAWGVTGSAAATLLQEGDEEGLAAVRELLSDEDEKIRVQAALILASVGSDPTAVKVLQEAYPHVEREMKVHILEALAHVGDPQSIPFLLEILKEPFQILRVVAASALIQCLYH